MTECRCDECRSFWHNEKRPFRCEVCGRRSTSSGDYFRHIGYHQPGELTKRVNPQLFGGARPLERDLPGGFHVVVEATNLNTR